MAYNITTNYELLLEIDAIRARFNALTTLHLYKNNYVPTPASALSDFVECDFSGYAEVDLSGEWSSPVLNLDGEYEMSTDPHSYTQHGGATGNTVYGIFIDDGTEVVICRRFDTPIAANPGSLGFELTVLFTMDSRNILP